MALLVADIGGTHARFAIARTGGDEIRLSQTHVLAVDDYGDLPSALRAYAAWIEGPLPESASFALATDINGDVAHMINSEWIVDRRQLILDFGFENCLLLNDFEAVAHSVAMAGREAFVPLFGPRQTFDSADCLSIVGPGTGLGVAQLIQSADGHYHVVPTEGGHIGFAPQTALERKLHALLSDKHGRVSVERVAAGPALLHIFTLLGGDRSEAAAPLSDAELWTQAINGTGGVITEALEQFVQILGAVVGDLVLAQGSQGVIFVGSLAGRLQPQLRSKCFQKHFLAKGRFAAHMANVGAFYLQYDQPGLRGAALYAAH